MLTLKTTTLTLERSQEESLETIEGLIYGDALDALAELSKFKGKPFTGSVDGDGFVVFPVQRGRFNPMPRLRGEFSNHGGEVLLTIHSGPNLNTTLHLLAFALFGLAMTWLGWPRHGVGALALLVFPGLFIFATRSLLLSESARALAIIAEHLVVAEPSDAP